MDNRRGSLIGGVVLILIGLGFLALQLMPEVFTGWFQWPTIIIGIGALFIIVALVSGEGGFAVPGVIVGGIGGILYYQNATGNWESWAYIWTLIPGFVGLGIILSGIIDGPTRETWTGGLTLIAISAIGFFFFSGVFGLGWDMAKYWPVILIVVGIIALIQAVIRPSR